MSKPNGAESFPRRVYAIVRAVPRGRVITYGAIAQLLGDPRKAREVGWAMAATPDSKIPAHRVINARGLVSTRSHGSASLSQRLLLEREGVHFDARQRVSFARFAWKPRYGRVTKFSRTGE